MYLLETRSACASAGGIYDDINKVICIALTGRTPRDLLDSVDPDWLTTPREKLTEAIKAHLASQDWPSSPFDDELAFGSDEADRNIASVAQQWVSTAAFQVAMQEGAPREIIDAMEAMRLRVGWGVMQPEPSDRPQLIDGIYEGYRLSIRRGYPYDERPAWIDLETSEDA